MTNIEIVEKSQTQRIHSANIPYGFFVGRIDNEMYNSYRLFIKTQTATDNKMVLKDIIIGISESSCGDDMPVWSSEDLHIYDYHKIDSLKIEYSLY